MVRIALALLFLIACSKNDDTPDGLCARSCKKLLDCAHASEKLASCVHACTAPDKAKVEAIEAASCEELTQAREVPISRAPTPRTE